MFRVTQKRDLWRFRVIIDNYFVPNTNFLKLGIAKAGTTNAVIRDTTDDIRIAHKPMILWLLRGDFTTSCHTINCQCMVDRPAQHKYTEDKRSNCQKEPHY